VPEPFFENWRETYMDLDNLETFKQLDQQDMYGHIDGLPGQLEDAWNLGARQPLPAVENVQRVLIAGMGGSAIGADLLSAYIEPTCSVPVAVLRDYDLPAWASGPQTLVIASSHSGNTEETLSVFEQARERNCSLMAISTGGRLAELAGQAGATFWQFEHRGQPRAAVGYSFGLLVSLFARLGLIPDPAGELKAAVQAMRTQQANLAAAVKAVNNPAKRLAGQMVGRWVAVMGAGHLAPVARRWKGQISEVAKAWAQFEFLPEANHNTMAGVVNPEDALQHTMVMFLKAASYHPRNSLRFELTRKAFMMEGLNTDFFVALGEDRLSQMWTTLHFGDYTAYYLAMAYGVDPTPVEAIESFKMAMKHGS
jgi:glucose/mannose-6-phosphate isomerase